MTERKKVREQKSKLRDKADTSKNSETLDEVIVECREREARKYPLRIDARTVIFVPKHKCNEEYAEAYRNKMKERECGFRAF